MTTFPSCHDAEGTTIVLGARVAAFTGSEPGGYHCPAGTVVDHDDEEDGSYVIVQHDAPDSDGDQRIRYRVSHYGWKGYDFPGEVEGIVIEAAP